VPSTTHLLGFVVAAVIIVLIPGPSLLFTIGRALAAGRRAALLTVVGNAAGLLTQIAGLALGLGPVLAASPTAYLVLKVVGAGYLAYLGARTIIQRGAAADALRADLPAATPSLHALRDGYLVGLTNPKTIVFFAALLPQFVDRDAGRVGLQMLVLGMVFAVIAIVSDGAFALAAGTARAWFARSPGRLAAMSAIGGAMMIVLAVTLLLA
jgi:threonine/homoserine/homoserine lactone efflux protein